MGVIAFISEVVGSGVAAFFETRHKFNRADELNKDDYCPKETKELIGLTSSLVVRCDDCVKYHLGKCSDLNFKTEEVIEAMSIATLIGGTIVIPHLRKALEYWDELNK